MIRQPYGSDIDRRRTCEAPLAMWRAQIEKETEEEEMAEVSRSWWAQAVHDRLIALVLFMCVLVPLVAVPAEGLTHGAAALVFEGFCLVLLGALLWRSSWRGKRE